MFASVGALSEDLRTQPLTLLSWLLLTLLVAKLFTRDCRRSLFYHHSKRDVYMALHNTYCQGYALMRPLRRQPGSKNGGEVRIRSIRADRARTDHLASTWTGRTNASTTAAIQQGRASA